MYELKRGALNLHPVERTFWSYSSSVRSGIDVNNWAIYELMGLPASIHSVSSDVCVCVRVCDEDDDEDNSSTWRLLWQSW